MVASLNSTAQSEQYQVQRLCTASPQWHPSSSNQILPRSCLGPLLRLSINWQLPIFLCAHFTFAILASISRDRLPGLTSNLPLSHQILNNITAMSRVTPPVTKFTHALRRISSSANAGRPSSLLDSRARASTYLPRNLKDLRAECKQRKLNSSGNKAEVIWDPPQCLQCQLTLSSLSTGSQLTISSDLMASHRCPQAIDLSPRNRPQSIRSSP